MYNYPEERERELHETNEFEDDAFPLGLYTATPYKMDPPGRGHLDMHWHEEIQFTLLVSGHMKMQVNGVTYDVNPCEAVFVNRNCVHMTSDMTEDASYVSIAFPYKILGFFTGSRIEQEDVLPYVNYFSMPSFLITYKESWMREVLDNLWNVRDLFMNRDAPHRECRIALRLNLVWLKMLENCMEMNQTPVRGSVRRLDRVKSMLTFVAGHYMERISVRDLAEAAGISESECSRCFHDMTGKSPKQYLLDYRITRATELLNQTDDPITGIALDTGFGDTSYFVQYFRKKMGVTPKAYRKKGK